MIIAGTGHRPPRLGLGYSPSDRILLTKFAELHLSGMLKQEKPVTKVISGGAQGWDQALAEAAIALKIPLVCAVPFANQDSKWPDSARRRYRQILDAAKEVVIVSPGEYHPKKFIARDHWMVDNCDSLVTLWDGVAKGGTWETIKYGRGRVAIGHCWDIWLEFQRNNRTV